MLTKYNDELYNKGENHTSIIIDSLLLKLLDEVRSKVKMDVFHINRDISYNFEDREKVHREIIELYMKNTKKINFTPNYTYYNHTTKCDVKLCKKGNPNIFAFFIALIHTNEEVEKGWDYMKKNLEEQREEKTINGNEDIELTKPSICCCGQRIYYKFELSLYKINKKINIGCDCIDKLFILTKEEKNKINEIKKKQKEIKELQKYNKKCSCCNEYNISKEETWKSLCIKCYYIKKKNYKLCLCKKNVYNPIKYTSCYECNKPKKIYIKSF